MKESLLKSDGNASRNEAGGGLLTEEKEIEMAYVNYNVPEFNGMFLISPMCSDDIDKRAKAKGICMCCIKTCIIPCTPDAWVGGLCAGMSESNVNKALLSNDASESIKERLFEENKLQSGNKSRYSSGLTLIDVSKFIEHNAKIVEIPLFLIHSKQDKITDIQKSQVFFDNVSSEDKQIKIYDKGGHFIWHDVMSNEAYKDVNQWLKDRNKIKSEINAFAEL